MPMRSAAGVTHHLNDRKLPDDVWRYYDQLIRAQPTSGLMSCNLRATGCWGSTSGCTLPRRLAGRSSGRWTYRQRRPGRNSHGVGRSGQVPKSNSPPLRLRSGQARSQRTRPGWGTPVNRCSERLGQPPLHNAKPRSLRPDTKTRLSRRNAWVLKRTTRWAVSCKGTPIAR